MPPVRILNAPTRFMKELSYGEGYECDPGTADGFPDADYLPDGVERQALHKPTANDHEHRIRERLKYQEVLRASKRGEGFGKGSGDRPGEGVASRLSQAGTETQTSSCGAAYRLGMIDAYRGIAAWPGALDAVGTIPVQLGAVRACGDRNSAPAHAECPRLRGAVSGRRGMFPTASSAPDGREVPPAGQSAPG